MNWYKIVIAGTKQEYLQSFGVSSEIIAFIMSQNEKVSNVLVNEVRKNPKLSLQQLQNLVNQLTYKPKTQNEETINNLIGMELDRFKEPYKTWVAVQIRKMRPKLGLKEEELIDFFYKSREKL